MFCANCGVELKEGAKFCPECGTKAREAPAAQAGTEPERTPTVETAPTEPIAPDIQSRIQEDGAKAAERYGGGVAAAGKVKQKKPWTKKKALLLVGGLAALLLVVMLLLPSGGEKYASGIVEADNDFGLSTTLTLDDFLDYYNDSVMSRLEVDGVDAALANLVIDMYCVDADELSIVGQYSGITEYAWRNFEFGTTTIESQLNIAVDDKTGYIAFAVVRFPEEYDGSTAMARRAVAIFDALCKGNSDKASDVVEKVTNDSIGTGTGIFWDEGITYFFSLGSDGYLRIGFWCMTKDYYENEFSA